MKSKMNQVTLAQNNIIIFKKLINSFHELNPIKELIKPLIDNIYILIT